MKNIILARHLKTLIKTTKLNTKFCVSALCLTLPACGDKKTESPEKIRVKAKQEAKNSDSIIQDSITTLTQINKALTAIKDLDTANKTLPELVSLGRKMKMIKTDSAILAENNPTAGKELKQKFNAKLYALKAQIGATMQALKQTQPEAYKRINKVMTTIM